ncbi:GNAT family N-acetyltransferase [Sphaerisporangium sp. NPDC049003]|uniref:GNAT family N-acetyltransferase n=1 Tax=Sphaerisporangium sp. NPDC049003 TaxID=3364517 RepID=UPI0037247FDD
MPGTLELRPVVEADLHAFDAAFQSEEGASAYQWFGFTPTVGLYEALRARRLLGGPDNMLSVIVDGELSGRVEWLERRWGRRDTSLCWEIAIGLLPDRRGRGIGTRAQRELVRYLFTHTRVERVQATTDPENRAEVRCLEKVGFRLEGTVRRAQWRGGRWHDQLLFSVLRDEFDLTAPDTPADREGGPNG